MSFGYDGSTKTASVTPNPSNATYSADLTKGPGVGSYTVSATANGSFSGSGSATLTISAANATFSLSSTSFTYNGSPQGPSILSSPGGASYSAGGTLSATNAGTYTATASAYGNYTGSNGSLTWTINKATPTTLTLNASTTQNYGTTQTLTTSGGSGSGAVSFAIVAQSAAGVATLSGAGLTANSGAGWVDVQATQAADANYNAGASATVRVNFSKAAATVTLGSLNPVYDGTPKVATATTAPAGLSVGLTYNGSGTAPSAAGSYPVVGTISDANYAGSASGTMTIGTATQATLTLNASTTQAYNATQTLTSSGGSGGGAVTFSVVNQSGAGVATLSGAVLTATSSTGWVDVQTTKAADTNYNAATSATVRITMGTANQGTLTLNAATTQVYNATQTLATSGGSGSGAVTFSIVNQSGAGVATLSGAVLTATSSTGWVDLQATKAADTNYNVATSATIRVTMSKANQATLTLSAGSTQVYNATQTLASSGGSGTGTLTYSIAGQSAAGVATLSGAVLTATSSTGWVDVQVTKAADMNYNVATSATVRVTMGKANQATVTVNASATQTYAATQTLTSAGGSGSGALTYSIAGQSAAGVATLSGAVLTATSSTGWVDVQVTKATDANYNAATSTTVRVTMGKAALTIKADNQTRVFGAANPTLTATYTGFVNGDTSAVVSGLALATSATTGSAVGSYNITASGAAATNYTISYQTGTLSITPLPVTFTFSNIVFTYDGGAKAPTINNPSGATYSTTGTTSAVNAMGYSFTLTATGNYSGTATCNWSIGASVATVTLGSLNQVYTGTGRAATATTVPASLPVNFTYDGSSTAPINVGSYAVIGAVADPSGNYTGSASGTLAITKANQAALTLNAGATQAYAASQTFSTTGGSGGGSVSYSIVALSATGAATLNGAVLTANTGTGWADVAATKAADANYNAVSSSTVRVNFTKAAATVTLGSLNQTYTGAPLSGTATTAPAGLTVGLTYNGSSTAPTNAGSYAVVGTINDTNYAGSASGTLAIAKANQAALTLAATATQTFGTAQTLSASGGSGTGTVSFAISGQSAAGVVTLNGAVLTANTGTGWVDLTATRAGDTNYNSVTSSAVRVTLAKAAASVVLNGVHQSYDGTAKPVAATTTPGGLALTLTYAGSSTAPMNAGSYALAATINDANYAGTASGTLVIDPAAQTVAVSPAAVSIEYGQTVTLTASGAQTSYVWGGAASGTTSSVTLTPGAGTQTVTVYAPASANYARSNDATVQVSVTKVLPTGTFTGKTANGPYTVAAADLNATFIDPITNAAAPGTVTYSVAAGTVLNAGTPTIITATYPGDANHLAATATATFTVNRTTPTLSWTPANISYGQALGAAQLNATASVPGAFTYTPAAGAVASPVGAKAVSAVFAPTDSANYDPASMTTNITVGLATQSINFPNPGTHTYGDASFSLAARATSGLQVQYSVSPSNLATISNGSILTIMGAGTITVTATQGGDSNYSAASPVSQTFTVNKANQTITFPNPVNTGYVLTATASSGLPIQYSSSDTNVAVISNYAAVDPNLPPVVVLKFIGNFLYQSVTVTASQPGDANYNAATSVSSPTLSSSGATSGWLTRPPSVLVQGTSSFPLRYSSVDSYGLRFESRLEPSGSWTQFGGSNGTGGRAVGSGDIFFSTPGTYTIHVLTTDGNGHESVDSGATLVISVLTGQKINFSPMSPQGVGFDVSPGATATSGLPVSYAITSGPATVNGSMIHINAKGWITVKASQAGNATYAPALDVSQPFLAVEPPKIQLEAHSTPSGNTGTLTGSGWAFDPQDGAPISVLLMIDGTVMPASVVTNGQARPDIQSAHSGESARDVTNSGWSFSYDISLLPYGTHTCVVRATNSMGVHLDSGSWTYTGGNTSTQQTITFSPLPDRKLGDAPFQLSATASSGLPVSFAVLSGPATISGNIVTLGSTAGTVTIQATQAGDATAHFAPAQPVSQSFSLGVTGPTGPTQLGSYPVGLTMMAKVTSGTGTATVVVGGQTFQFKFTQSGSNTVNAMPLEPGFAWFAVQQAQLGTTYPVSVTSSGLDDFIIKAKIQSDVSPRMQVQVECGGSYVDSITKAELSGGSFNLRVVPTQSVPFAGLDLSKFEVQQTMNIGLGASRGGQTAGLFGWQGGAYVSLVKGPALLQSWESDTHVQVQAPAGYADLVRTSTSATLNFYPNGSYSLNGGFNDFSATTPLATYVFANNGQTGGITRSAGGVTQVLEWEAGPSVTVPSTHSFSQYDGPGGGQVEFWEETTTAPLSFWSWRTPGAPRNGVSVRTLTTERTVVKLPNGTPTYQYQPIKVELARHSSATVTGQADSSDNVLSYEIHTFGPGDNFLVSEQAVSYGYGAEQHLGPSRAPYVGTGLAISPIVAGNGLGGGNYTEYFSDAIYAGHSDNFNGQPGIAAGEIRVVRQSFQDDPVLSATDLVTTYTYGSNLIDGKAMPAGSSTQQGSTPAGSSTYGYAVGSFNGLTAITTTVTTVPSASSAALTTIRHSYSRRASDLDLRDKPLSIINPDGTQVSYAYQRGTLSGSTWAANANGPHLLVAELHGKSGSTLTTYAGVTIDALDLDPTRSTVTELILDVNGQPLRQTNYVYTGGTNFAALSSVYYAYGRLGYLLMKADQPVSLDANETPSTTGRVLYKAAYAGWRKMTEEDEQGVAVSYGYDPSYDRIYTLTRSGASITGNSIAATTTTYTYDPIGRLQYESVSGGSEAALTTGYTYDTANRPKTKSEPGGLNTSINYDSVVQTTTTLPSTSTATATQVKVLYADGRTKSVTGSAVPDTATAYSLDSTGNRVTTVTTAGSRVATTVTDWIGRTVSVAQATFDGHTRVVSNAYNGLGQLAKQDTTVAGAKIALPHVYFYDTFGRLKREALDANANDAVDPGTDYNVKEYDVVFQQGAPGVTGSDWYRYDSQLVWPYDGAKTAISRYASQHYQQVSGLTAAISAHELSLDFDRNRTESTVAIDRSAKTRTITTTATGTTQAMQQVYLDGLLVSSTNAQNQTTRQTYDGLGRLKTSIDPRIGTSTYAYVAGTPFVEYAYAPDNTYIHYGYDTAGHVTSQANPASKSAYFDYDGAGNLLHQWGETVSPVRYDYNELGQKTRMHTYRTGSWGGSGLPSGFSADGDVTTWNYQATTGLLVSKQDAVNPATSYEYNDLDQLRKRTDSRVRVTSYLYTDPRGLLTNVNYTDGVTTNLVYTYDRSGRQATVSDATGQRSFAYYDSWSDDTYENELRNKSARLKSETLPWGFYGSSNNVLNYDYQYSAAGRANGPASALQIGASGLYAVGYGYDSVGRPNTVTYNGTAFTYTYMSNSNLIDTVSSAAGYLRDYDYQSNSNRLDKVKHSWGAVTASQMETRLTYDPDTNLRNTEKTAGTGYLAALGRSGETGVHADYTYTDRFELDSSAKYVLPADWTVGAERTDTARDYSYDAIGNRDGTYGYAANGLNEYTAAPGFSSFSYDENGNLTGDGARTYAYDSENRLIKVTQGGSIWNYVYDYLGRRVEKNGTSLTTTRYLYDGWNLLAELDVSGNFIRRFAWGLDVSGARQGAGGVGGLLQIDAGSSYFSVYDASHNLIALYTSSGAFAAAYEYDPFGSLQAAQGSYAVSNPFRAATKYTDAETGLVYYGMRYYHPSLGRFINRDPIGESGGVNLYAFCGNNGVNCFDLLGMDPIPKNDHFDAFDNLGRTSDPRNSGPTGPNGIPEGRKIDQNNDNAATYHIFGPDGSAYYSDKSGEWDAWKMQMDNERRRENEGLFMGTVREMGSQFADGVRQDWGFLDRNFLQPINQAVDLAGDAAEYLGDKALPAFGQGTRNVVVVGSLFVGPGELRFVSQEARMLARGTAEVDIIAARQALARSFYRKAGWEESRIESHLAGIDFTKPVDIVTLPKGAQLSQWNFADARLGNYFTEIGAGPNNLGIYTNGRFETVFSLQEQTQALRSTAAAATDTWSVSGWAIEAPGGGTQYFIPGRF